MSKVKKSTDAEAIEPQVASDICVAEPTTEATASTPDAGAASAASLPDSEFTRANVEALGSRVRLTDKDEATGLELFCYVRCGDKDDGIIRECRGVVFHKDTLIMRAFPYTTECAHTDQEEIETNIQPVFADCSFYDAHEGALIRMFYFGERWYTSTHRKLNAFRSKWASRTSFGTSFKQALEAEVEHNSALRERIPEGGEGLLESFQSTLDTSKQYMFLVRHSAENRIVNAAPERPTLYHVGTFVDGQLVMDVEAGVPYPQKHDFLSMDDLVAYVEKTDIRTLQGVICFAPDNKQYKILHKEYQNLFKARGNEPSIKFRYLGVRMNRRTVDMLYHLYPEMGEAFDDIENTLFEIAKTIFNNYVQRYIKKRFVTVPTEDFAVMRECHAWHERDRTNRVSLEKVITGLNQQPPTALNKMLRRWRNEKTGKEENKTAAKQRTRSNTIPESGTPRTDPMEEPPMTSPLLLSQNRRRNVDLPEVAEMSLSPTET